MFFFLSFSIFSVGQNYSIKFDGNDDVLTFPTCEALTASSFTIEGWVKSSPSDQLQVIMMAFQDNIGILNANVTLEIRNFGLLRFNYRGAAATFGGNEIYSKTVIQDGTWHHFAAVKEDNQRLLLYIDGFLESVSSFSLENISPAPAFEIGRNKYDGAGQFRWLEGSVDDFKIWYKSKTAKEVYEGFKSESSGVELLLYSNYKFDMSSDTIFDCSINKRHGIRQNISDISLFPQFSTDIPSIADINCTELFTNGPEEQLNEIRIFPNPTNNTLTIQFFEPTLCKFVITNVKGQIVMSENLTEKILEKTLFLTQLPVGTYVLNVISSTYIVTKKIEKM